MVVEPTLGLRFVVTENAVTPWKPPEGRSPPITDDMRQMIDDIRSRYPALLPTPGAYRMGDVVFIHPAMKAELAKRTT